MYSVSKIIVLKDLSFQDVVKSKETPLEKTLGSKRYKLFSESFKLTMEEYLKEVEKIPERLDMTVRTIRNDEHAKYERFFEVSTTLNVKIKDTFAQMDFTFEIFKFAESDEDGADLLSYYMAERLGEKQ